MKQTTRTRIWFFFIVFLAVFTLLLVVPARLNRAIAWTNIQLDKFKYIDQINIPSLREKPFSLGLDLQGGAHLTYEADLANIPIEDQEDALESARDIIERRVNFLGVAEPDVRTTKEGGKYRILVEIPGVAKSGQAIDLIGATPVLEFQERNLTQDAELTAEQKKQLEDENNKRKAEAEAMLFLLKQGQSFEQLAQDRSQDPGSAANGGDLGFVKRGVFVPEFEKVIFDELADGEVTKKLVESDFGWHIIKKIEERGLSEEREVHSSHILIQRVTAEQLFGTNNQWSNTQLSGKHLKRASVVFDNTTQDPQVSLEFNEEGTKLFGEITQKNIGNVIGIFIDGVLVTAPVVNEPITDGKAVIRGSFTLPDARELALRLNSGALPVPIQLVSQETVGAALGSDSLQKSLDAGLYGLIFVALFMILFYRLPGVLSVIALGLYALILLTLFKYVPVTMTLAGIAGFILSLGMAVDANVLVFERLKEELAGGRPLGSAIDESFKRAWLSIRDGHVSTLITCLILIAFSSSSIRGFAITLALGLLVSLFTALKVTKTLLHMVAARQMLAKKVWLWLGMNQ